MICVHWVTVGLVGFLAGWGVGDILIRFRKTLLKRDVFKNDL